VTSEAVETKLTQLGFVECTIHVVTLRLRPPWR